MLCSRLKANRAKRSLQKIATSKEEMKSAALAAGLDWESDDSNDEVPVRVDLFHRKFDIFLRDSDMCRA